MTPATPAAGTGLPRGAADQIPQAVQKPEVRLYDAHGHSEGALLLDQAATLETAGLVRLVRSQGAILRAYWTGARADFFHWQSKNMGRPVTTNRTAPGAKLWKQRPDKAHSGLVGTNRSVWLKGRE